MSIYSVSILWDVNMATGNVRVFSESMKCVILKTPFIISYNGIEVKGYFGNETVDDYNGIDFLLSFLYT